MSSLTLLRAALSCIILLSGLLEAKSLREVKNVEAVSIDSAQAHGFLSQARPRRNVDPKWHRGTPDFQSYYRFYTSIGHIEGLYEIDKIRMLYQQMRHLEQTYGADASSYQNALGVQTTTPPPTTTTTTQPPPPPTTQPPPPVFSEADIIHLCNPKDPLCKPKIVYLPTGAVPVLCDPRYHPACQPKSDEVPEAPEAPEEPAIEASPPRPPPPQKSAPAPEISFKGMEYDCDPYWDPDCLIDHPPRPVETTSLPPPPPTQPPPPVEKVKEEESAPAVLEEKTEAPSLQFDPYDYRRDLFNPYLYTNPAPEPQ
ncbi:actinodin3 [Osmerus mordax]|uniref:actinodin3 n=1 Tax=Osmerus mordax TaxID=8014 RepID=UPI0035106C14